MGMKLTAIVLAAGKSSRFGKNKLSTQLGEKKVLEYTLEKLNTLGLHQIIVVVNEITEKLMIDKKEFLLTVNPLPEKGISYSIKLGIEKGDTCDAYLFIVGDQPLMKEKTLSNMINLYKEDKDIIIGLGKNGEIGNPVIFPSKYKKSLLSLEGDRGGKYLIYKENLPYKVYEAAKDEELWDIDTPEDYEKIIRRIENGTIKE